MSITDLFIFTRDLRVHDNEGLRKALSLAKKDNGVLKCIFIFRSEQIGKDNSYRSDNSIDFMVESLKDLQFQLKEYNGTMSFFYEPTKHSNECFLKAVSHVIKTNKGVLPRIHMSKDYTPYSYKREDLLQKDLLKIGCTLTTYDTHLLTHDSITIRTDSTASMYQTFLPFYRKILTKGIDSPKSIGISREVASKLKIISRRRLLGQKTISAIEKLLIKERVSPMRIVKGGRIEGLRLLRLASSRMTKKYSEQRNRLDYETSKLSAYHHYGCISTRETWRAFSHIPTLRRQLVWRDYAYHMMVAWPETWKSVELIGTVEDGIPWSRNKKYIQLWKEGKTGVPSVDAAMKQLLQEGYINNRGRMVVANYLVKNLGVDWKIGEKYFAQWLTDYDRSVNFMNWIQIAAVLPKDQATRTMNPYIQAKKNDPKLLYIRKYIPILENADDKDIFSQDRNYPIKNKDGKNIYPPPIVDYKESRKQIIPWAKKYIVPYKPTKET